MKTFTPADPDLRAAPAAHSSGLLTTAVLDYLNHLVAAGRARATVESYRGSLALLEVFAGREFRVMSLSPATLDMALLEIGSGHPRHPQKSQVTLNRHRSAWRSFSRWAFETGRAKSNPAILLRLARADSFPAVAITALETRQLLSVIRESGDRLRLRDEALFSLYALTGVRRCEALKLDIRDYDAATATLLMQDSKNRRVRRVPVIPALGSVLDQLLMQIQSNSARNGAIHEAHASFFFAGSPAGKSLSVRQAQGRFQLWRRKANLRPELTIHSFRTGFATALYRGTGDLALVSRALGHRDLRPVLRYVELASGVMVRAMRVSFEEAGAKQTQKHPCENPCSSVPALASCQ